MKEDLLKLVMEFAKVESNLSYVVYLLEILEEYYDSKGGTETKGNLVLIKRLLDSLVLELSDNILKLETYVD